MLYAVHCLDKPGALQVRLDNRADHLAYITKVDSLVYGGPMFQDDGETFMGSLLIFDLESREELDAILAADPYAKAELFGTVTVSVFKHTLPKKD